MGPQIIEWEEAWVVPGLRWGWFELSLGQGVNNLPTFPIEKAQRERKMFHLKYNIKSSPKLSYLSLPHVLMGTGSIPRLI
jgi:hypothetical protein